MTDDGAATAGGADLRTVGVLGGMSAASTVHYYEGLNAGVNRALGGHHAASVLLYSVDFGEVTRLMDADRWDDAGDLLADAARRLDRGGADFVIMATNTMHRVAPAIEDALSIPFVHVVDVTADAIREAGLETVGLLGTETTTTADFYRDRLADHGVDVVVPDAADREHVDRIIFDELVHGEVRDESRDAYRAVAADLVDRGAEGVVFGCTEIGMLLDDADVPAPVFDTTTLHVERAVELCLGERPLSE